MQGSATPSAGVRPFDFVGKASERIAELLGVVVDSATDLIFADILGSSVAIVRTDNPQVRGERVYSSGRSWA